MTQLSAAAMRDVFSNPNISRPISHKNSGNDASCKEARKESATFDRQLEHTENKSKPKDLSQKPFAENSENAIRVIEGPNTEDIEAFDGPNEWDNTQGIEAFDGPNEWDNTQDIEAFDGPNTTPMIATLIVELATAEPQLESISIVEEASEQDISVINTNAQQPLGGVAEKSLRHNPLVQESLEGLEMPSFASGKKDTVVEMTSDGRKEALSIDTNISDTPPILESAHTQGTKEISSTLVTPKISATSSPAQQVQFAVEKHVVEEGVHHFTMDLNPKELGKVKVEVTFDSRDNSRHISIRTETPEALQALKEGSEWLRLNLSSQDSGSTTSFDFSQETDDDTPGFQSDKKKNTPEDFGSMTTTIINLPPAESNLHLLHEVV